MPRLEAQQNLGLYVNELKVERAPWEGLWRETSRLTLPSSQFNYGGQPGQALTEGIYDGTSILAANRAAAELLAMTLNPNSRNFEFYAINKRNMQDKRYRELCEHVSESIHYLLYCEEFGFYTAGHELLIEFIRFGQGHFLVERVGNSPRYLSCPVSQCYTELNDNRKVDSGVRLWQWTLRQLRSRYSPDKYEWPPALLAKLDTPQAASFKVCVGHAMVKSSDHPELAALAVFPGPYTHAIFLPDYGHHVVEAKGIQRFPMPSPRYLVMSEESQGRGPGTLSLPDARMVNAAEKTNVRAVQKQADPPMILPRRGWIRPIDSAPAALNYYDGLEDMKIQSFGVDGNPQLSQEFVDRHRQQILEFYNVDQLMGPGKRAEMKEVEVLGDQEDRMRVQAPQLARLWTEWLAPTMSLLLYYFSDEILESFEGELPEEVQQTGRLDMAIKYMSPLQRAQSMLDASNVKRVLDQFFLPVLQINPNLGARFDDDGYADWLQDGFNLPSKIILSKEKAEAKIAASKQQQDAAMAAGTALDASAAYKNVAQAQAALPQPAPGSGVI